MDIDFRTNKLRNKFSEDSQLKKHYGTECSKLIKYRLAELRAAEDLTYFWPPNKRLGRCHRISKGLTYHRMSLNLKDPYILIFKPNHDPYPLRDEGGLDWSQITAITILDVKNTRG